MKHVIVMGGGVAGMTAAHELIDRGYSVTLYEARSSIPGALSPNWDGVCPSGE